MAFNFDETILRVINANQQRQAEADRLKQEMQMQNRQMSLLEQYRNNQLAQNQQQLDFEKSQPFVDKNGTVFGRDSNGLINFNNPLYTPPSAPKPVKGANLIPWGGGLIEQNTETTDGKTHVTGYGNYYKPDNSNSANDLPDISSEVGNVSELIGAYDNKAIKSGEYGGWKAKTTGAVNDLMTKVGLPPNSPVIGKIRKAALGYTPNGISDEEAAKKWDGLTIEEKRQRWTKAIGVMQGQNLLNPAQVQASKLYIQAMTR